MIIQKKVNIRINYLNFKYYESIINDIHNGDIYEIETINLHKGSHTNILVECDICNTQSIKPYRQYLESYNNGKLYCCSPKCSQIKNRETTIKKYGVDNVFQNEEIKNKIKITNNKNYGKDWITQTDVFKEKSKITNKIRYNTENAAQSEVIKNKMKKTCLEKYGKENYNQTEEIKEIRIKNGTKIPDELKSNYDKYKFDVRKQTDKIKKNLFENWNGLDYYDNENIREYLKLYFGDKNYPTIDHKISIYFGFINNIEKNIISDIKNLCITKRSVNSSKNTKCSD
jgi:hypothetical protein